MHIATFTLRIESTDTEPFFVPLVHRELERLQTALSHAEDIVNDALPEGFYCKIDESGEGVDLGAVRELEKMADDQGR